MTDRPRGHGRSMASIAQAPTPGSTRIRKLPRPGDPAPNVADYDEARRAFTWEAARAALDGLPGGRAQHRARGGRSAPEGPRRGKTALRCLARCGRRRDVSYRELAAATSRFADVARPARPRPRRACRRCSVGAPEHVVAALGTLKRARSSLALSPGPSPRAAHSARRAPVLVTTPALYRPWSRRSASAAGPGAGAPRPRRRTTPRCRGHPRPRDAAGAPSPRRRCLPTDPTIRRSSTSPAAPPARPRPRCTATSVLPTTRRRLRARSPLRGRLLVHGRPGLDGRHRRGPGRAALPRCQRAARRERARRPALGHVVEEQRVTSALGRRPWCAS